MADNLQYQQFNASKKYVSDAEFTSLDTSTIPVGTEYNIVYNAEKNLHDVVKGSEWVDGKSVG